MTETQSTIPTGDLVTTAINDLMAWHSRALTRIFYPHVPTDVAPIAMPEAILNLHQRLDQVPDDIKVRVHKGMLIVRDASAAMAAESVTGHVPDYRSHVEFQKYYQDLVAMLRTLERDAYNTNVKSGAAPIKAPIQMAAPIIATPLAPARAAGRGPRDEETALQRYIREQQGTARPGT